MSEGDKGISYKMEEPGQDILINAPHMPSKIDSTAKRTSWVPSDRLVSSTRTIFLPSRYDHAAWPYHEILLGTSGRMRDSPGVRGILAAWTEGGRETRSETVRPQESRLRLSKVPQKANYSRCPVDPRRTRAPLQVTEGGCEG